MSIALYALEFVGACVGVYAVILVSEIVLACAVDVWEEISR